MFILGPFVLCGGLFGFLKLLPMYSWFLFNPKKFELFFLAPRDVSSNPWCETMEKGGRGQRQMARLF
jgi:hypothetical protein